MQNKIINHESPPKWIFVEKKRIHGSTPNRNFNLNRIPLFREKSNCGKKLERLVICFPLYSNKLISFQGLKTNVWGSFWLHREPQEILLTAVDKSGEFWPKVAGRCFAFLHTSWAAWWVEEARNMWHSFPLVHIEHYKPVLWLHKTSYFPRKKIPTRSWFSPSCRQKA